MLSVPAFPPPPATTDIVFFVSIAWVRQTKIDYIFSFGLHSSEKEQQYQYDIMEQTNKQIHTNGNIVYFTFSLPV